MDCRRQPAASYGIRHWGAGSVFDQRCCGRVRCARTGQTARPSISTQQVDELRQSGLSLPLLVRFPDIPAGPRAPPDRRLRRQHRAPGIPEPLHRAVPDQGQPAGGGDGEHHRHAERLHRPEAGSKPELLAVLALAPKGGTIVCNGYKDREFIRLALMGQKARSQRVHRDREGIGGAPCVIEEAAEAQGHAAGRPARAPVLAGTSSKSGRHRRREVQVRPVCRADSLRWSSATERPGLDQGHPAAALPHGFADRQHRRLPQGLPRGHPSTTANCASHGPCPVDHITSAAASAWTDDGTHSRNASSINYDMQDYPDAVVDMLKEFLRPPGKSPIRTSSPRAAGP